MFIRNLKDIRLPKDIISVDDETKKYLQRHGFLPVGLNGQKWVFTKTETLTNILNARQKEVAKKDADS